MVVFQRTVYTDFLPCHFSHYTLPILEPGVPNFVSSPSVSPWFDYFCRAILLLACLTFHLHMSKPGQLWCQSSDASPFAARSPFCYLYTLLRCVVLSLFHDAADWVTHQSLREILNAFYSNTFGYSKMLLARRKSIWSLCQRILLSLKRLWTIINEHFDAISAKMSGSLPVLAILGQQIATDWYQVACRCSVFESTSCQLLQIKHSPFVNLKIGSIRRIRTKSTSSEIPNDGGNDVSPNTSTITYELCYLCKLLHEISLRLFSQHDCLCVSQTVECGSVLVWKEVQELNKSRMLIRFFWTRDWWIRERRETLMWFMKFCDSFVLFFVRCGVHLILCFFSGIKTYQSSDVFDL